MVDLIIIATILAVIVILTKLKWNLGVIMIVSTGLLVLSYRLPVGKILEIIINTSTDFKTINLILVLTIIRGFEYMLRKEGLLTDMMATMKKLLRGTRAGLPVMPALIGMLPSVGGALFSAPMVEESARGLKISPEKKSFINYWFRHPWEFILPLYPGILLASGISGIPLRKLILSNSIFAIVMVIAGSLVGLRNIKMGNNGNNNDGVYRFRSFIPFLTLLIMVIVFHIDLLLALIIELIGLFIFLRSTKKEIVETIKESISWEIIALIFGVMIFKTSMEMSGAVKNLSIFFTQKQIPIMPLLFILPFITGMLTGFTVGFVGSTFPLLLSLVNEDILRHITFAFCSGYSGVLLSPVHLCLVLTRQYFDADLWRVYKRIIPATLAVLLTGVLLYLFGGL